MVGITFLYIGLIIVLPAINVFLQAFSGGFGPFWESMQDPDFLHAIKLTLALTAWATPINTVFGIVFSIFITRNNFRGKQALMAMLDLPFSISPVVTGLCLVLLYGRTGWFAGALDQLGWQIVFAFPGMVLATLFVTLPLVAGQLIPVLEEMDLSQEEAARSLGATDMQAFWEVTLPNIRWGLLYGLILTNARAMGEFGAVAVVSGNIIGRTQTMTLYVEGAYKEYNTQAAFSASVLLSVMALSTLFLKTYVEARAERESKSSPFFDP